jgi:uncharacterized membrane protein YbhN (UPF0104 family)
MNDILQYRKFKKYLFLIIGFILIYFISSLINIDENKIVNIFRKLNYIHLSIAISLYLISHSVRVLRLVLLSPKKNSNLLGLLKEQYKANGVSILLPFKLGESYRLIYFRTFFGSYSNSFSVLLSERLLDLLIIFLILSTSLLFSPLDIPNIDYIFFGSLLLLIFLGLIYFSIEVISSIFINFFTKKEANNLNTIALNISTNLLQSSKSIKKILNQKYIACLLITFLIWSLEISAFFIFFEILNARIDLLILLAIAVSLSSLLPNGPLGYGGIQLAFYTIGSAINNSELIYYSFVYSVCFFGSGLIVACTLFIYDFFMINTND